MLSFLLCDQSLIDGFPAIFLREMVFKGKEEKKERTSICEFCLMISIPLRALETHQPSSRPASAVCPKVLHLRSYISCLVVLHWPSSGPTSAVRPAVPHQLSVQQSCISRPSSSPASVIQWSCKPFLPWAPLGHFSSPTSSSHVAQDPLSCPDV